jgi:peptidoglycan/xylan/chitin deacetylase (PgdA/CDA1 family)
MNSRRKLIKILGISSVALAVPGFFIGMKANERKRKPPGKKHIISLSFDDGFKKSCLLTARIFEKHNLSACFNVIATGHLKSFISPDPYQLTEKGDFGLWNELKARGHEIMMHGYKHQRLDVVSFEEGKSLTLRCIDVFSRELKDFKPKESIYNFPNNKSTPELEAWLPSQVKAFRTRGGGINPLPYKGQVKLTTTGYGPANCEAHLNAEIEKLLAQPSGWLIYNVHGLDDEGWGPLGSEFLDQLLYRLEVIDSVAVLPTGKTINEFIL